MIFSKIHSAYFADQDHLDFYSRQMAKLPNDSQHNALAYTLGICKNTRKHFDSIFSVNDFSINPAAIDEGWQTGSSRKVTRLAFQLFTDKIPTATSGDEEMDINELSKYSVSDIFCCHYAPYFFEAVKIRYPEYTKGGAK